MFKKVWGTISTGSTMWGLLPSTWQAAVAAGLSIVTGYFGYLEGGLARAIFLASGVFAFGITSIFLALRISQLTGIFQRLSVAGLGVAAASINEKHTLIQHLNLTLILKNDSQRLMFYRLKRINCSIARQTPVDPGVDKNTIIIPPNGGVQQINLSTIENIPIPKKGGTAPSGRIELEVEYGSSKDHLTYLIRWVSEIQLGVSVVDEKKHQFRIEPTSMLKELEHSVVK